MTALEDTRPLAELSVIPRPDHRPEDIGCALQELLAVDPGIELASIRITTGQVDAGERISIAGRVGALVDGEPGCPSCHVHGQQPHTEYCQATRQCEDPEPHKSHIRFDDSPHNVCPGRLVRA